MRKKNLKGLFGERLWYLDNKLKVALEGSRDFDMDEWRKFWKK